MTVGLPGFPAARRVLIILSLALSSAGAAAAQSVGTGPLTEALPDTEPTGAVFNWGSVKFAPGVEITEFGYDSNVFDDAVDPRDDWVFRARPDVSAFSLLRFAKISLYFGSQLGYFKTYSSESSADYEYRGRVDVLAGRLQPFIGGGETNSNTRPNGEIDTRADQRQRELSGGLAFSLRPDSKIYGAVSQSGDEFFNAIEDGVDLSETMNQDATNYSAGLQTALTPLTTLTVYGSFQEDRFESAPLRNADTSRMTASVRIATDAVISGNISVSYIDFEPVDPLIEPYQGLQVEARVIYPLMEFGWLGFSLIRGIEYSYDRAEGYYEELSTSLSYTHFLFGEADFQVRGSKSWYDYGARVSSVERTDTLDAVAAGVGYNLRNRTRLSVNYEFSRKRSPVYVGRNYDRTRIYLAWAYAF